MRPARRPPSCPSVWCYGRHCQTQTKTGTPRRWRPHLEERAGSNTEAQQRQTVSVRQAQTHRYWLKGSSCASETGCHAMQRMRRRCMQHGRQPQQAAGIHSTSTESSRVRALACAFAVLIIWHLPPLTLALESRILDVDLRRRAENASQSRSAVGLGYVLQILIPLPYAHATKRRAFAGMPKGDENQRTELTMDGSGRCAGLKRTWVAVLLDGCRLVGLSLVAVVSLLTCASIKCAWMHAWQ
jgi:hypothetical protein